MKNTEKKLITFSAMHSLPKIQNIADIIKGSNQNDSDKLIWKIFIIVLKIVLKKWYYEDDIKKMRRILALLDEEDDVQNVYHNWDEPIEDEE